MKTLLLTIFITFSAVYLANAQLYEKAAGIRLGYTNGIYFDKQNEDFTSYRFMMSARRDARFFTAMKIYRRYKTERFPDFISFYYGYGAHAGFETWNKPIDDETGHYVVRKSSPVLGLDIIAGVSYDFDKLPISITADFKPVINFLGKDMFGIQNSDFAIGAVYSF